jgi:hypothetical protein
LLVEPPLLSGVELAYDASLAVPHVPDERARVSLSGEGLTFFDARIVDSELDGLDADFIFSKRDQAGVASDSEVGRVAVLADDEAALTLAIEFCRVGEVLLRGATLDPELSIGGQLERGRTTSNRIEHRPKALEAST